MGVPPNFTGTAQGSLKRTDMHAVVYVYTDQPPRGCIHDPNSIRFAFDARQLGEVAGPHAIDTVCVKATVEKFGASAKVSEESVVARYRHLGVILMPAHRINRSTFMRGLPYVPLLRSLS